MKLNFAFLTTILALGFVGDAHRLWASAPLWRTLATETYPKKRDNIVFVDAHRWRTTLARIVVRGRSLGFVDSRHGFLGYLGTGLAGITDATPLYETKDGGMTWQAAKS